MATLFALELRLDRARAKTMMRFLPYVIHVRGENGQLPSWARPLAEAGYIELENRGPGSQAVVNRLTEMLFIQAIRSAAQRHSRETRHQMGKVRWSPQVFNAVRLIQGQLAERWSVAELAARVGMSRSAFAAAFTREMEVPPMQYLAAHMEHIRQEAHQRLGARPVEAQFDGKQRHHAATAASADDRQSCRLGDARGRDSLPD